MTNTTSAKSELYTGQLSYLEERLAASVKRLKQSGPLNEVWVIVPNQLTRLHLRRVLAKSLGVVANVRAMTITDLMHRLAEPLILNEGWSTLGEAVLDPLLAETVDSVRTELEYLKPVAGAPGFRRALMRSRQELILHQISPIDLSNVPLRERERAAKLRDLVILMTAINKKLADRKLHDGALLQELALRAQKNHTPRTEPLLLYSLYDLAPLTKSVLRPVISSQRSAAFLPWVEGQANYKFTSALRNWYLAQEFSELPEVNPPVQYPSVRVISAPKDSSVATEIVRDVLYTSDISAGSAAILLPKGSALTSVLESRCRTSGLSPYIYQAKTLGQTPEGRGLAALARLVDGRFTIEQVRDFLNTAPLTQPESSLTGEWIQLAAESHVMEGEPEWQKRLTRTIERLDYKANRLANSETDEEDISTANLRKRIENAKSLQLFLSILFATVNEVRSAKTWQLAVSVLWEYYRNVIDMAEEFADLTLQLEQATQLDSAGVRCSPAGVTEFILATLETPGTRVGSFGKSTPLIAPREQCVGASFPHVFLPGFNEGTIPHMQRQDPLLLDGDRKAVNESVKSNLPLASEWQDRERFLFEMQLRSATSTLSIYISRADAEGRPQLASPYVNELLAVQRSEPDLSEELETLLTMKPNRIVPAHPLEGAELIHAIDESEFHRLALGMERKSSNGSINYLSRNIDFMRSLSADIKRFSSNTFSNVDGLIEDDALQKQLAHRFSAEQPMDATALEEYWKCPFRFAATRLLEAVAPEAVNRLNPVTARERGILLHKILQRYHSERLNQPITQENYSLVDLLKVARNALTAYAQTAPVGPRFSAAQLERELLSVLQDYHSDLMSQGGTWRTRHVEASFGYGDAPFLEPVFFSTSDKQFIRFKGRIDRWDSDDSGAQILITDYKSGHGPNKSNRTFSRRVQLAIYHLLAETSAPEASVNSRYYYPERDKNKEEDDTDRLQKLTASVILTSDIRNGIFVPEPAENDSTVCMYCSVKLACGAQRHSQKSLTAETVKGMQTSRQDRADESEDDHDE